MTRAEAIDYLKPIADSASMKHYRVALNTAIEALQEEKTPEIIYCRECRHYRKDILTDDVGFCTARQNINAMKPEEFCSLGAREAKL